MYGVPANLPLERFVSDALFQVCVGVDGVHFNFGRAGTISVFGKWELRDTHGSLVDQSMNNKERTSYRVHVILNADVSTFTIDPPRSFSLTFSTDHHLTIYDDTSQYESFTIQPDNIIV